MKTESAKKSGATSRCIGYLGVFQSKKIAPAIHILQIGWVKNFQVQRRYTYIETRVFQAGQNFSNQISGKS